MFRDTARRMRTALLIALFLVVTPPAFAAGFSDLAFEVELDLSLLWSRIVSTWTGDADVDALRGHDLAEKTPPSLDPLGDEGEGDGSTQQSAPTLLAAPGSSIGQAEDP